LSSSTVLGAWTLLSLAAPASGLSVGMHKTFGAVTITRGDSASHCGQPGGASHSAIGRMSLKGPQRYRDNRKPAFHSSRNLGSQRGMRGNIFGALPHQRPARALRTRSEPRPHPKCGPGRAPFPGRVSLRAGIANLLEVLDRVQTGLPIGYMDVQIVLLALFVDRDALTDSPCSRASSGWLENGILDAVFRYSILAEQVRRNTWANLVRTNTCYAVIPAPIRPRNSPPNSG
jgi:hypothetical protein